MRRLKMREKDYFNIIRGQAKQYVDACFDNPNRDMYGVIETAMLMGASITVELEEMTTETILWN